MPNPSHVIQFIIELDKMLIPEFHHYLAYFYMPKFVYTNTGLESTTKQGNLKQYLLKITILEIRFMGQRLFLGISQ